VASRYGAEVSGATELALTQLDSLSGLDTLKICTSYRIGSRTLDNFPITPELFQANRSTPKYPAGRKTSGKSANSHNCLPPPENTLSALKDWWKSRLKTFRSGRTGKR
jgi:adenylosuccinate synthase